MIKYIMRSLSNELLSPHNTKLALFLVEYLLSALIFSCTFSHHNLMSPYNKNQGQMSCPFTRSNLRSFESALNLPLIVTVVNHGVFQTNPQRAEC